MSKNCIINVNKPSGITSFKVVSMVKKILHTKKVGHLGTLDPLASGVLPIAVNRATKLFDYYLKKNKVYIAEFEFGYETTTLDCQGEIVLQNNVIVSEENLKLILPDFIGESLQVPPVYSAKKINGKRSYDLARQGVEVQLRPALITIYDLELLDCVGLNKFRIKIKCSAGTYIRSLGRDIAKKLKTFATMTSLVRIQSGNFLIENALSLEELENITYENMQEIDVGFDKIILNENEKFKIMNGVKIPFAGKNGFYQAYDCLNNLIGIVNCKDNLIHLQILLYEEG